MTILTRAIAPSMVLVAMLAAGCSSASSSSGGGITEAPAASPTASASPAPPAASVIPTGGTSVRAIPSDRTSISAWASDAPASGHVYLAESQDPRGTTAREPRCGAGGTYFWTHASFDWPAGLPAALSGGDAPVNPWDFSQLRAQATASCAQP